MFTQTGLALFVFALVTSATPGPNTLMLLASGVNFGFRQSAPLMIGVLGGFCLLLLAIGFGLGALLLTYPALHSVLKVTGGAYLLYLAWRIATVGSLSLARSHSTPMPMVAAMLFQWVNPKAWMMGVTAMALYTQPEAPYQSVLWVTAVFGAVGIPTVMVWAGFGAALRDWLNDEARLKRFNRLMGLALALTILPMLG